MGQAGQAPVVSGVVVARSEGRDLSFTIAGQVIVLKQNSVLERPIPALDRRLSEGAAMFISRNDEVVELSTVKVQKLARENAQC